MMRRLFMMLAVAGLSLLPAGCARLPGGAPLSKEVLASAQATEANFAIYPVTGAFLPLLAQWPHTGTERKLGWINSSQGSREAKLQPGDRLTLQIWDSSDDSLLTAPSQRVVQLQNVIVDSNGTVFLPYVGEVMVRGLTPNGARKRLQGELEMIVPSAQLQLALNEGRGNSVDLVSGVASPGSYPMPDRNFTVMGLIAAGGGIRGGFDNPQIRLVRGGKIFGTSVQALLDHPHLNTRLRGGDQVYVQEDERYFLSFGATSKEDLHHFTKDNMSAMDAVAIIGGLQDRTADPKGLLILREYGPGAVTPRPDGPDRSRVIFTLDLTQADGLFSARHFRIQSGDLVMATESPINDAVTVTGLIGSLLGVVSRAQDL